MERALLLQRKTCDFKLERRELELELEQRENLILLSSQSSKSEQYRGRRAGYAVVAGEAEALLPLLETNHAVLLLAVIYGEEPVEKHSIVRITFALHCSITGDTDVQEREDRQDAPDFCFEQRN